MQGVGIGEHRSAGGNVGLHAVGQSVHAGGMIEGQEERGNAVTVQASIPLSEMFGYATDLRSFTQGRGNYTMIFDRYEPVPKSIREEIIKKNGGNN